MSRILALLVSLPVSAFAQAAAPAQPSLMIQLLPFLAIFAIIYFLTIRPQVKKQKMHQEFITTLKRGDEVLTSSGIFGTIEGLTDKFVTLEIADGIKIRILRSQISGTTKEVKE